MKLKTPHAGAVAAAVIAAASVWAFATFPAFLSGPHLSVGQATTSRARIGKRS